VSCLHYYGPLTGRFYVQLLEFSVKVRNILVRTVWLGAQHEFLQLQAHPAWLSTVFVALLPPETVFLISSLIPAQPLSNLSCVITSILLYFLQRACVKLEANHVSPQHSLVQLLCYHHYLWRIGFNPLNTELNPICQ
jgi:hypothetical protein